MLFFPALIAFALFCLVVGWGIQNRKKWAWYAGAGVQFFTAGGAFTATVPHLFFFENPLEIVGALGSLIGVLCIWCCWAVFWAGCRNEFR